MDSKKLAQLCRDFADNKKAENIVLLDVRKVSTVTDYFVIASGSSIEKAGVSRDRRLFA